MGENVKILDSIHEPDQYDIDDSMILPPLSPEEAAKVEIVRGPNIKFLPVPEPPQETLVAPISLKARDNYPPMILHRQVLSSAVCVPIFR